MVWWIVAAVLVAGALCVAYGMAIEQTWFRLSRYRLDILPADAGRLSILHLSDLHFQPDDRRKARFLAGLPTADVAVVTGDILGEADAVEPVVEALRPVRGRLASYFVLGSNDYYRPRPTSYLKYFFPGGTSRRRRLTRSRDRELVEQLTADGWVYLHNVRRDISLNGTRLEVVGLDDPHIHRSDLRVAPRRSQERFGLAVVHSPDPAPELAALGYELIVAGHTHGGQVRLPVVGALVTNSHMPRRMASGMFRLGPSYLHVSQGMGTSKYAPFRFLCRPGATLLDLQPADGHAG
ncbi:MAG: metallophosphoesterase [Actinomycetota bacterium]|nr:metallophosphoesterase [Actinomycetota bacterium]